MRTLLGPMRADSRNGMRIGRHAQLVWFDPGSTCGVFVCSVSPDWLDGKGEPSWAGLGHALSTVWFAQLGRNARIGVPNGRNVTPSNGHAVAAGRFARVASQHGAPVPPSLLDELAILQQQAALLDMWPDAAWGYESFTILRPDASRDYAAPVRINARVEAIELLYGARGRMPFTQSSSYALSTATDERLKLAGLYRPGQPHATDAARHAAVFLRDARKDADLRTQAWPKIFGRTREESA